jgi:hypothetical protein
MENVIIRRAKKGIATFSANCYQRGSKYRQTDMAHATEKGPCSRKGCVDNTRCPSFNSIKINLRQPHELPPRLKIE